MMTPPQHLLERLVAELRRQEQEVARTRQQRDRWIAHMHREGWSTRAIGEVAGISGPAVHKIITRMAHREADQRTRGR